MVSILVAVLVFMLVVGLIFYIARQMGAPQPWLNIGLAIVCVFFLIWLIYQAAPLLSNGGGHLLR